MSTFIEHNKTTTTLTNRMLAFYYGDECITFERTNRVNSIQRVLIKVYPDCRVCAHAPSTASDAEVLEAVKKRARWIYQQLRNFREQLTHITPRQYISGESYYYLGKQYMLKVLESPEVAPNVKLFRGKLEVTVQKRNPKKVQALIESWYKSRAKEIFAKRLDAVINQTLWVTEQPPLHLRTMKTQWGSCSPNGRLTLNPHLVKAPCECIDYVILHELCHIAEHNHSEQFYRLMKQVMPSWEKVKSRLDSMAASFLNGIQK
ncbi:M48 family metallopeptidase [Spartinivicinus ruber]|uniref:M48 family metallopeptidase n=1 Tax=Spartinivicinus ruber TaxID=2683272 RepID=UPI001E3E262D|nr:SprT family zinc-dependent metalloprotease [Spartinivicinus ruber]